MRTHLGVVLLGALGAIVALAGCNPQEAAPSPSAAASVVVAPIVQASWPLDGLSPDVRAAAEAARALEIKAKDRAEAARKAGDKPPAQGLAVIEHIATGIYEGPALMARYEGEVKADVYDGLGVLTFPDSATAQAGEFHNGLLNGLGVERNIEGQIIYEGYWRDGSREGLGVNWSSGGKVLQAGVWKDYGLRQNR